MPGKVSLRDQQYYAHPRNLFWKILGEVLGFDPTASYERRVGFVKSAGVAVWDVLQTCTRESSLDSDIDDTSAMPNDFAHFYANHPQVRRVCFNGAKAEALYGKFVRPRLAHSESDLVYIRLPSTSPANAAVPYAERLRAWTAGIQPP
jgi:TDG/mug DNA glycosylase family protein